MQDLQREIENIVKDELKRKLHGGSLYYGKAHENRNLLGGLMLADGKKMGGLMLADGKKAKKRGGLMLADGKVGDGGKALEQYRKRLEKIRKQHPEKSYRECQQLAKK
jgi:hypothetical protein